jgi:hypothetical protein
MIILHELPILSFILSPKDAKIEEVLNLLIKLNIIVMSIQAKTAEDL